MAKKRGDDGGGGGDSWMNTYADMVTLLLTFFAVMLSMSNTDEQKFNAFIKSFSSLPQGVIEEIVGNSNEEEIIEADTPAVSNLNDLYLSLKKYVEENNQEGAVEVSTKNDIIYVRFNSMMFFNPDESTLLEASLPTMDFIGNGLKKNEKDIRSISICGHTANIEGFGTSNVSEWTLSTARASTVAIFFVEDKKIDGSKIIPMGYGGEKPIADNSSEAGRVKNRRVELVIVGTDSKFDFNAVDPTGKLGTAEDPTGGKAESGTSESGKTESSSAQSAAESQGGETTSEIQSSSAATSEVSSASTASNNTEETGSNEE